MSTSRLILNNAPISFSLHPLSYPYQLTGSVLFIMQPFSDLSGPGHRLLPVYLKEIVLSDIFTHAVIVGADITALSEFPVFTWQKCSGFVYLVHHALPLNVVLAGVNGCWLNSVFVFFFCKGFSGRRGEVGDPSSVRCRRHGGFKNPRQAEHSYLRLPVLQLLQRTTSQ